MELGETTITHVDNGCGLSYAVQGMPPHATLLRAEYDSCQLDCRRGTDPSTLRIEGVSVDARTGRVVVCVNGVQPGDVFHWLIRVKVFYQKVDAQHDPAKHHFVCNCRVKSE